MKICSKCRTSQTATAFARNRSAPDGLDAYCKACRRSLDKARYIASGRRKQYLADKNKRSKQRNQRFVARFLRGKKCTKCGFSNSIALDFDHIDPSSKTLSVSEMANTSYGLELIKQEIRKCRILCSNCHRIHTYTQMQYQSRS